MRTGAPLANAHAAGAGPDSEIEFEIEAVLLEYPRPPADIGNTTVPIVRRPDGKLERILALTDSGIRYGRGYRHQAESCQQAKHPHVLFGIKHGRRADSLCPNSGKMQDGGMTILPANEGAFVR